MNWIFSKIKQIEWAFIFFFRCRWNFQCSRSSCVWFAHETSMTFIENYWFVNNYNFAHARLSSFQIFCVCEIDWDSCSIYTLFCRTFCKSLTTCLRLAYNIAHAFITNSDANCREKRVFRFRESKRAWREKFSKYFENICFE